jgi:hypothetical protein
MVAVLGEVCGVEWDAGFSQWIVDVPAMQDDVSARCADSGGDSIWRKGLN